MSLNELLSKDPKIKCEQIQVIVNFQEAQKEAVKDQAKKEKLDAKICQMIKNANDMFNQELYQKFRAVKSPENKKPTLIGFIYPKMVCLFHLMRAKIYYDVYLKKKISVKLESPTDSQIIQTYVFNEKIYIVHFQNQKETQLYQVYYMDIKDLFQRDGEAAVTFLQIPYCIMQDYGTLVEIEDSALIFVGREMTIIVEDLKKNTYSTFKATQKRKQLLLQNQLEEEKKRQKLEAEIKLEEQRQAQAQNQPLNDQSQQQSQYPQMAHNHIQNIGGGRSELLGGFNSNNINQHQKIQVVQQSPLISNHNQPQLVVNAGSYNNQPPMSINLKNQQFNSPVPNTQLPQVHHNQGMYQGNIPTQSLQKQIGGMNNMKPANFGQNPPMNLGQPAYFIQQVNQNPNQQQFISQNNFHLNNGIKIPPQQPPIGNIQQVPTEIAKQPIPQFPTGEQSNNTSSEPTIKEPNPEDDIKFIHQIPEYYRKDFVVTSKRRNDLIIIQNTNMIYQYSMFPIQDHSQSYVGHSQGKIIDTTLNFQDTIYGFLFHELNSKRVFVYEIPELKQQFACEVKNQLPFLQLTKMTTSSNDINNRICCFLGAAKYNNLQIELPVIVVFNKNDRTFEVELI